MVITDDVPLVVLNSSRVPETDEPWFLILTQFASLTHLFDLLDKIMVWKLCRWVLTEFTWITAFSALLLTIGVTSLNAWRDAGSERDKTLLSASSVAWLVGRVNSICQGLMTSRARDGRHMLSCGFGQSETSCRSVCLRVRVGAGGWGGGGGLL